MKVEKKITKHGNSREAEMEYYREAQVCPECGCSSSDGLPVLCNTKLAKVKYLCRKCGCKWEVEPYREERKAAA